MLYIPKYIPFNTFFDNNKNILFDYTDFDFKSFTSSLSNLYQFKNRSVYKIHLSIPTEDSLDSDKLIIDCSYCCLSDTNTDTDNLDLYTIYEHICYCLRTHLLDPEHSLVPIDLADFVNADNPTDSPMNNPVINECFIVNISRSLLYTFLYRIYFYVKN